MKLGFVGSLVIDFWFIYYIDLLLIVRFMLYWSDIRRVREIGSQVYLVLVQKSLRGLLLVVLDV